MDLKNTIVNVNQNSILLGAAYCGVDSGGCKSRRLVYRNTAIKLIEKYCTEPFKALPESSQYHHLEFALVGALDLAKDFHKPGIPESVQWPVEMMARDLKISPIILYNDPDLPDFLLAALKK